MIATADLQKLFNIHQERAHVAAANLARCKSRLNACRLHISNLEIQTAAAESKFSQDCLQQMYTSKTAAHLRALPSVIALFKLRHHDQKLLLDHQVALAREEMEEIEVEYEQRQKAVFAANAKIEKFASLLKRSAQRDSWRDDDHADEQVAEEHTSRDPSYAA